MSIIIIIAYSKAERIGKNPLKAQTRLIGDVPIKIELNAFGMKYGKV